MSIGYALSKTFENVVFLKDVFAYRCGFLRYSF